MKLTIPKDIFGNTHPPRLFLCHTNKETIGELKAYNISIDAKWASYSELSFTIDRVYTDELTGEQVIDPLFDLLEGLRKVRMEGYGYFVVQDPDSSYSDSDHKTVICYSSEYETSAKFSSFLINTGEDDSAEVIFHMELSGTDYYLEDEKYMEVTQYVDGFTRYFYKDTIVQSGSTDYVYEQIGIKDASDFASKLVTYGHLYTIKYENVQFYNPNKPRISLLNIIFKNIPSWSIGYVDDALCRECRSFNEESISIYDFIMNSVCDAFKCIAEWDTETNTVSFYVEEEDGVTDDNEVQTRYSTDVFISRENLANNVNIKYQTDNIKTKFKVEGADGINIREINLGNEYILNLDYYHTVDWMGQNLYDRYAAYKTLVAEKTAPYQEATKKWVAAYNHWNDIMNAVPSDNSVLKVGDDFEKLYCAYTPVNADYATAEGALSKALKVYNVIDANGTKQENVLMTIKNDRNDSITIRIISTTSVSTTTYSVRVVVTNASTGTETNQTYGLVNWLQGDITASAIGISNSGAKIKTIGALGAYFCLVKDSSHAELNPVNGTANKEVLRTYGVNLLKTRLEAYQTVFVSQTEGYISKEGAKCVAGDTAPQGVIPEGTRWLDTSGQTFRLKEYSSSQWVDITDSINVLDAEDYKRYIDNYTKLVAVKEVLAEKEAEANMCLNGEIIRERSVIGTAQYTSSVFRSLAEQYFNNLYGAGTYSISTVSFENHQSDGYIYPLYICSITYPTTGTAQNYAVYLDEIIPYIAYRDSRGVYQYERDYLTTVTNIESFFTTSEWERLSPFIREDVFSDSNFLLTGYESEEERTNVLEELLKKAEKEAKTLSQPSLEFSADMANLLAMPEFEPIKSQFALGNFIRVGIRDDYVKRARLLEVKIDFDDMASLVATFGNLITTKSDIDKHADLLKQAVNAGKTVASSSGNWQRAVDKSNSIDIEINNGLKDVALQVASSKGQAITWDERGILCRKKINDEEDEYEDKQMIITNNRLAFTEDNWETSSSVFGEYTVGNVTKYGVLAKCVDAGYVRGSEIEGGSLLISGAGGSFKVDEDGNVTITKGTGSSATEKYGTVQSVQIQYALGDNSSTAPTSGWSTDSPVWTANKYIWQRTVTTLADGTTYESNTSCIQGAKGENGYTPIKGVDYFDGTNGDDGTSIVFKGSYANPPSNPENGWSYYNTTAKASYVYQGGAWYQMSVDGVNGQNGTSIVWKGESERAPSNPSKDWVYRDTTDGKVYIYNGSAWEIMVLDGSDGEDGADGSDGLSVFITYHDNPATSIPDTPTGSGTSGGWHTDATSSAVWLSQKVSSSASSGSWGTPIRMKGTDGVSISAVSISYGVSSSPSIQPPSWQSTVPEVGAGQYLWTRVITDYTDESIDDTVTYTYSRQGVNGQAGTSVTVSSILYQSGTSNTIPPTGTWTTSIPAVAPGNYLWSKTTFSDNTVAYSLARQGANGVGTSNTVAQFYLSTSKTEKPGDEVEWLYTAPTWEKDKYIWTRSEITYTDGRIEHTEPMCDSSWEAVNDFATTVVPQINNLQAQVDGKIESWFYSGRPSSAVLPESQWGSADVKRTHVGDNYYDTDSGYAYTYKEDTYQETDVTSPIYTFNLPSDVQNKAELKSISGRTIVWNQLVKIPTSDISYNAGGVTFIDNRDGSFSLTATNATAVQFIISGVGSLKAGHKIAFFGSFSNSGDSTHRYVISSYGTNTYIKEDGIYTINGDGSNLVLQILSGDTLTANTKKPQIFDLTQMFGGNEPSTVAEFKAMFPNDYYAYDAGSLLSGKCDKVVSIGKNIYDISKTDTNSFNIINGKLSNKVADTGRTYFGLMVRNASNNSLIYGSSVSTTGIKNVTFTLQEGCNVKIYHSGSTKDLFITKEAGIYLTTGTYTISFNLEGCNPSTVGGLVISDFMLERGSSVTTYEPYAEHECTIPSAIQQLPGYGWSAGNAYNEVDFVNKKYIRRVASVDLGSLTWTYRNDGSGYAPYFYAYFYGVKRLGDFNTVPHNIATAIYTTTARNSFSSGNKIICADGNATSVLQVHVKDSSYTDAAAFKTAMSGVILYYELAEPIETDISAYLPVDNSIEIESSGTITLHQSNYTRIKLPNSITYLSKATSGTYFRWEKITDSAVALAMKNASTAQITADNKMQVFVSQPTPPYDVGDLWAKGTDGDGEIMRCSIARASGDFDANDWVKAGTSTDKLRTALGDEGAQVLINGNHIKAGTIDAGVVTVINLDADNITTGEMSATRVRTGTLESTGYSIAAGATFSTTGTQISLDNGYITTPYFAVNSSGAFINGSVTATSGSIGGWNIKSEYLESKIQKSGVYYGIGLWPVASGDSSKNAFAIGDMSESDWDSCAFRVTGDGVLHATGAQISGNITATSGTIGGCSITNGVLNVPGANITGTISAATFKTSDYSYTSGNFLDNGVWIGTSGGNGEIWSKYFTVKSSGAYFKGTIYGKVAGSYKEFETKSVSSTYLKLISGTPGTGTYGIPRYIYNATTNTWSLSGYLAFSSTTKYFLADKD